MCIIHFHEVELPPKMEPGMNPLHIFLVPSGRIGRQTWWLSNLALVVTFFAVIFFLVSNVSLSGDIRNPLSLLQSLLNASIWVGFAILVYWWCNFALGVKRLHDTNRSAWWLLLWFMIGLIPFVGTLIVFVWSLIWLGFFEGDAGPNRYGDDPSGRSSPRYSDSATGHARQYSTRAHPPPPPPPILLHLIRDTGRDNLASDPVQA